MINAVGKHHPRANLCMLIRSQYIKNDFTAKFSLVLGIKVNLLHYDWGSGCVSGATNYIPVVGTGCNYLIQFL